MFLTAKFEAGRQQQRMLKNHAQCWKQKFHFQFHRQKEAQTSVDLHLQTLSAIYTPSNHRMIQAFFTEKKG